MVMALKKNNMKKGPFKMKGMTFKSKSPVRKTGKYSKEAQRLLDAVPNKAAYDRLSPQAKATFDKAAKKYGLPTKNYKKGYYGA